MQLKDEVELLRRVPLFAGVAPSKLKLLAFTSDRFSTIRATSCSIRAIPAMLPMWSSRAPPTSSSIPVAARSRWRASPPTRSWATSHPLRCSANRDDQGVGPARDLAHQEGSVHPPSRRVSGNGA